MQTVVGFLVFVLSNVCQSGNACRAYVSLILNNQALVHKQIINQNRKYLQIFFQMSSRDLCLCSCLMAVQFLFSFVSIYSLSLDGLKYIFLIRSLSVRREGGKTLEIRTACFETDFVTEYSRYLIKTYLYYNFLLKLMKAV